MSNPERRCCENAALNMPANLENSAVAQHFSSYTLHRKLISKVLIYLHDLLLSQFGTSVLFHVQF